MLGEGAQRECEKDARPFRDDAGMTWHLDNTSPRPPPSESVPRFLWHMPGSVNRCTREHTTFYSSTSREENGGEASRVKASPQQTISFSSYPASPARGRRRLSRTVDSWQEPRIRARRKASPGRRGGGTGGGEGRGNIPHSLAESLREAD